MSKRNRRRPRSVPKVPNVSSRCLQSLLEQMFFKKGAEITARRCPWVLYLPLLFVVWFIVVLKVTSRPPEGAVFTTVRGNTAQEHNQAVCTRSQTSRFDLIKTGNAVKHSKVKHRHY